MTFSARPALYAITDLLPSAQVQIPNTEVRPIRGPQSFPQCGQQPLVDVVEDPRHSTLALCYLGPNHSPSLLRYWGTVTRAGLPRNRRRSQHSCPLSLGAAPCEVHELGLAHERAGAERSLHRGRVDTSANSGPLLQTSFALVYFEASSHSSMRCLGKRQCLPTF